MRVIALATIAMLIAACSSPTRPSLATGPTVPGEPPVLTMRGTVSATVDGARWEAPNAVATTTDTLGSLLTITGAVGADTGIGLSLPFRVGTVSLGESPLLLLSLRAGFDMYWTASSGRSGSSGAVTITTATPNRVAGTFSFTAVLPGASPASRTVTNGVFDLSQ